MIRKYELIEKVQEMPNGSKRVLLEIRMNGEAVGGPIVVKSGPTPEVDDFLEGKFETREVKNEL